MCGWRTGKPTQTYVQSRKHCDNSLAQPQHWHLPCPNHEVKHHRSPNLFLQIWCCTCVLMVLLGFSYSPGINQLKSCTFNARIRSFQHFLTRSIENIQGKTWLNPARKLAGPTARAENHVWEEEGLNPSTWMYPTGNLQPASHLDQSQYWIHTCCGTHQSWEMQ